jgi:hypothetical protein
MLANIVCLGGMHYAESTTTASTPIDEFSAEVEQHWPNGGGATDAITNRLVSNLSVGGIIGILAICY